MKNRNKMMKISACTLLGAGMVCGLVFANTPAKEQPEKVASIALSTIPSDVKDIIKSTEKVTEKKSAKKVSEPVETIEKTNEPEKIEPKETTKATKKQAEPAASKPAAKKQTSSATPQVSQPEPEPQPQTEAVTHPIAQTALSLVGAHMHCEEVAEASINAVGKTAWITKTYMDGDVLVYDKTMGPDNFLQIGTQVSLDNLQQGDLLYYANGGSGKSHIAVYVGNGQVVHGGYNGVNVAISGIYLSGASTPIGLRM